MELDIRRAIRQDAALTREGVSTTVTSLRMVRDSWGRVFEAPGAAWLVVPPARGEEALAISEALGVMMATDTRLLEREWAIVLSDGRTVISTEA